MINIVIGPAIDLMIIPVIGPVVDRLIECCWTKSQVTPIWGIHIYCGILATVSNLFLPSVYH